MREFKGEEVSGTCFNCNGICEGSLDSLDPWNAVSKVGRCGIINVDADGDSEGYTYYVTSLLDKEYECCSECFEKVHEYWLKQEAQNV